jgi:hypothetical protein
MRARWLAFLGLVVALEVKPAEASGLSVTGTRIGPGCETTAIKGTFGKEVNRYEASGTCHYFTQNGEGDALTLIVGFSAVGAVEPGTGATRERIKITAPYEARQVPAGRRPNGEFEAMWNCVPSDKWLEPGGPNCHPIRLNVTGDLDPGQVRNFYSNVSIRPITSWLSPALHASLLEQRRQALDPANQPIAGKATSAPALAINAPRVAAPAPGSQYRAQSPLAIRVTPPSGTKPQSYLLRVEKKNAAGGWELVTNLPASASEAESATGYTGFGAHKPGTPANMQATPGAWRVSAQVTSPTPSKWSTPNEFTVVGADVPRLGTDALQPAAPGPQGGAASKLKVR